MLLEERKKNFLKEFYFLKNLSLNSDNATVTISINFRLFKSKYTAKISKQCTFTIKLY